MTTSPIDYAPADPNRRADWATTLAKLGPFIGLVFVYLLFTVLVNVVPGAQRFATPGNMELMLRQTAVVGTAVVPFASSSWTSSGTDARSGSGHGSVEDDGYLWLTSAQGIARVEKRLLHAVADGTAPSRASAPPSCRTSTAICGDSAPAPATCSSAAAVCAVKSDSSRARSSTGIGSTGSACTESTAA